MATEGVIKFETNVPQIVALAYSEGRTVHSDFTGEQLMFSTTDGRRFYVPPIVGDKLREQGVTARMPIELCRKQVGRSIEWQVRTHNAAVGKVSEAKPTTARVQSDERTNQSYSNMTPMAARILASYVVAFEVAACLEQVVDERGLALNFTREEHIRAIAATAFIEANKQQGGR